jgi:ABC-type nitrate/sulfonate/bicarbonate transport system permease component
MARPPAAVQAALQATAPVLILAVLFLLLELAVRGGLTASTIAAPSVVLQTVAADRANIWHHVEPTLLTASTGFLIALALALLLGFVVYVFKRVEGGVLTVAAVLTSIPMVALAPALVTFMGLTLSTRITITTVICVFPMIVSVVQGLTAASKASQELFVVLAASPWQRFRMLALPTALPYLFLGAKIAAPLSLLGSLIAEWTGAEEGLGVYMLTAMFGLHVAELWTAVLVACVLSMAAYGYVALMEYLAVGAPPSEGGA